MRIEDLDTPRTVQGAADDILRTLERFGLCWDEAVLYQSQRTAAYQDALHTLQHNNLAYLCVCSRKEIADSALHGIEGQIYPGTCRNGIATGREGRAWRVRTDCTCPALPDTPDKNGCVGFDDSMQGYITQQLEHEIGDFVIKRADGLFAYQLAVVVDDAFQKVTHVVRGADLLSSTPRQIYLQRLLGLFTPAYMHLPVAVNAAGEKLSKQTLATPVSANNVSATLWHVLATLGQQPPEELVTGKKEEILDWGAEHWDACKLRGVKQVAGN